MVLKKKKRLEEGESPYKTNLQKVKEHYAQHATDSRFLKVNPDSSKVIRILPPWGKAAQGIFYFTGGLHYGVKIGGRDRAIPCRELGGKGLCPVCQLVRTIDEANDSELKELTQKLSLKKKFWINVIDRKDEPDYRVYIYGLGKKALDSVMEAMEDEDYGDITDPENGHDLTIKRRGSGMYDTKYTITIKPKPRSIGMDDWHKQVYKLDQVVLEWMEEDEVEKILLKNYPDACAELGLFRQSGNSKPDEDDEDDEEE